MNNEKKHYGITFLDALTLIFITLKLIGVIDWSWMWVLAPIWIVVLILIVAVFAGVRK